MFSGLFTPNYRRFAALAAASPSLATQGVMRETKPA
jgi:hypothetical protein